MTIPTRATARLCTGLALAALLTTVAVQLAEAHRERASGRPSTAAIVGLVSPDWDRFSADVTMRLSRVRSDGTAVGPTAPETTFHLERSRTISGISSVASFRPSTQTVVGLDGARPLSGAPRAMRLEDDGNGTPIRAFNAQGQQLRAPTDQERQRFRDLVRNRRDRQQASSTPPRTVTAPRDMDALVYTAAQRQNRQQAVERLYGPSVGQVRGFVRYLKTAGNTTSELLVDPESFAPVETNMVRNGSLATHTVYTYSPVPDVGLVQHRIRSEQGVGSLRLVTETELTNIRFERGRQQ